MQKTPQLVVKNLLNTIHGVVGSRLFQHLYLLNESGEEVDAYQNGNFSCAYVVSGVLVLNDLINKVHATVAATIVDLEDSGWYKTDKPVAGSIIHWPANGNGHEHLGFYIDEHTAMSNSSEQGMPVLQGIAMPDGREPIAYFTHPKLQP